MLRVRLIGGIALEIDGSAAAAPASRRARSLLAWLALHPGPQARGDVAARFWPDMLDASARTNLRSALLTLRSELGPAGARHLVTSREAVGLAPDVFVDALEFQRRLDAGEVAQALELGDGELLPGLDDEWVYAARDGHRERLGEAFTRLADAAERDGDLPAAVRWTRRLVALDPVSEELQRRLIRLLAAAGDRAAALAAFTRLRERLAQELHLAPSLETRRLVETIRADAGAPPPDAGPQAPPPPPLVARDDGAFVGREDALERLRAAWSAVAAGGRRLVLVGGEAGIGKTRAAAELAALAHGEGAVVLYGRCRPEAVTPYEPFTEALRDHVAKSPIARLGSGAGELARILPGLAEILPPPLEGDPDSARYRLFEAVSSALEGVAAAAGALLVLDDLHWADRPTLLLLAHTVRAPARGRLLVVGTHREDADPLAETLAELRRDGLAEAIVLEGLREPDVAELIGGFLGEAAPAEFARAVQAETAGNPFFVGEVLRHLRESGALMQNQPLSPRTLEHAGVPDGVKDLIGRRLARLGERTNHVLAIAAVAGRGFDYDVLEWLTGLDEDDLLGSLEEAVAARLIAEDPRAVGRFGFTHALVRETLYDALTATRRTRLHGRIAKALEDIHGRRLDPPLAELAYHFSRAARAGAGEDAAKAVEYGRRAGAQALRLMVYEEAADHYDRALRCLALNEPVDGRTHCELLLELGEAQQRAGWFAESRATFERATAIAREDGDHQRFARAALGAGGGEGRLPGPGRVDEPLVELLEEALAAVRTTDDPGLEARLLARLSLELYWSEPRRARREAASRRGLELARRSGDRGALAYGLIARRFAVWGPDDLDQRVERGIELRELARESGNEELALHAGWARICDLLELGDLTAAYAELETYDRLARERRAPYHMFGAACWRVTRVMLEGRLQEADRMADETFEFGRQVLPHGFLPFHALATQRLVIRRDQGRLAEQLDVTRGLADRLSPNFPAWRAGLAAIYAELGRDEEARDELEALAAHDFKELPRDFIWLCCTSWLGEACALLRDARRAGPLYEQMLPHARKYAWAGYDNVPLGPVSRILGLLAAVLGRRETAARHFEDALSLAARMRARPDHARTQKAYADMLLARDEHGDRQRAVELLDGAIRTAEEIGMQRLREDAAALRRGAIRAVASG